MSIAIATVLVVLFVLGTTRTLDLAKVLREPENRQRLLIRVLGFVLMSMWLHALPSMLMLNYLRFEGILASDILSDDAVRTATVGLFGMLQVSLIIGATCFGLINCLLDEKPWRWRNLSTVAGAVMALGLITAYSIEHGGLTYALYLGMIVIAFSFYIHLSMLSPLEMQVKLYALPFVLIGLVTALIFIQRSETHSFVAEQLRDFRSGGSLAIAVEHDGEEYLGRLVLMTSREIFLSYVAEDKLYQPAFASTHWQSKGRCLIVLPRERSVLIFPRDLGPFAKTSPPHQSEVYCRSQRDPVSPSKPVTQLAPTPASAPASSASESGR